MTSKVTELKTKRAHHKEHMLSFLKETVEKVEKDEIKNLIIIADQDELFATEVLGDVSVLEVVGMLDMAKLGYQFGMLGVDGDDG